jgi:hypothetical protein
MKLTFAATAVWENELRRLVGGRKRNEVEESRVEGLPAPLGRTHLQFILVMDHNLKLMSQVQLSIR